MLARAIRSAITSRLFTKATHITRSLHSFNGHPPSQVVIANNSLLFFTLASINAHKKQFGRNIHADLHFIAPPFWLDSIHPDHESKLWGQNLKETPYYTAKLFLKLYPNHTPTEPITWLQYKQLRAYAFALLEHEYKIPIYRGIPTITDEHPKYFHFSVNENGRVRTFTTPRNVYVYDWHRDFKKDHNIAGIPQISHTRIYQMPKSLVPKKLVVLGDGESVIWLAGHFPDGTIYYLSHSALDDPLYDHAKPSHQGLQLAETKKIFFDSRNVVHSQKLQRKPEQEIDFPAPFVSYTDQKTEVAGFFFTCTGMPAQDYTSTLFKQNALRLKDELKKPVEFFGPRNVGYGTLLGSFLTAAEATGNMAHSWEPDAGLLHKEKPITYMQQLLIKYGIKEEKITKIKDLVREKPDGDDRFFAMVKLFKENVSDEPKKVADFVYEIRELYHKPKLF